MRHKNFVYYNLSGVNLLFSVMPFSMVWYCILQLLHGLSWVLQVVSMQYFFDAVTDGAHSTWGICLRLLGMGLAFLSAQVMNGVANCYGQILNKRAGKEMNKLIFQKIAGLNAVSFEDTRELDRINKASKGSEGLFWVSTTILDILFFYAAYFVMMSWYLFSMAPVLGISIVIIFIPNVLAKLLHTITFRRLEEQLAPLRRRYEYYEKCMTDGEYYKETRLLGANEYFRKKHEELLEKINRLSFRAQLRKEAVNSVISVLTVLAYGGVIFLLFVLVIQNTISVGAFVAVFASLREFYGFMYEVISERFGWAAENVATVGNFLTFVKDGAGKVEKTRLPRQCEIRLENVSFSYPQAGEDSRNQALEKISLTIPWGQTVALVGENGSGKSTLCHVIAGLYMPTEGAVYYGKEQCKNGVSSGVSAVFQKYCRYKMTLRENICISETEKESAEDVLLALCEEAGVDTERAGGLDGMLGKDFGGTELSGGQWQRIAIARGLFRSGDLLILDEPTASIDPLEENRLYQSFQEMCRDRTAVIVTHRLASARFADRIVVLKDGKIVQDGSHEQLLASDGEYKELYEMQRNWYAT